MSALGIYSNIQLISVTHPTGFPPLLSQVVLPQRKFQLHRLKLSEEEETVYSVLFTRSRWVPWRSTFSLVLLLFCPWLGSGFRVKSSQTVFLVLLIRQISVPFFINSLSCSLPPPQLTFVSLTLKAFEAALHWLPCIKVPGDLVLVGPCWEIISLTFDLLPSISLELKKLLRNPCHLVFALSVNPSPSLNPDILPHYLSLPA